MPTLEELRTALTALGLSYAEDARESRLTEQLWNAVANLRRQLLAAKPDAAPFECSAFRHSVRFGERDGQITAHRLNINYDPAEGLYLHLHEAGRVAATERKASCRANTPEELRALAAALLDTADALSAAP